MMIEEARARAGTAPLGQFLASLFSAPPVRVKGTAVHLTIDPDGVPFSLLNNLEHNGVLHNCVLFVNVAVRDVPRVPSDQRVTVTSLEHNCWRVVVEYGFKDEINLPQALASDAIKGLPIDTAKVSYFLSHAMVVATGGKGMAMWRERLFAAMSHNMANVAGYMKLPAERVVELGTRVEI